MNRTGHDHQRDQRGAGRKSVNVVTEVTDVITGLPLIGPAEPRSEVIYRWN